MKNHTIISVLFFSIFTVSCNESNSELKKINVELQKLQKENSILKDSISKIKKEDWNYKMLVGVPEGKLKVGEKNKIFFFLYDSKQLQDFDVYKIENKKEIKIRTEKFGKFSYEYIPKSELENKVSLKIKIPNNDVEIMNETTIPLK
ncbi:hypothetical protein FQU23_014955 [Flavobacterium sp. XN-5]|uniref:hypothetical protein n=1 Tax=Flavobacterium sp. XN-5 TaxID=2599390 RepID=UPI0011CBA522|nr:hypothetical protein [Flavobacterium sp. XN-5]NGY38802.1 hypothetical protein [Flavobacterium sp. XN-5]